MNILKLFLFLIISFVIISCGSSSKSNSLQGCCSHHGGVSGCSGSTVVCNDGWRGSSCSCGRLSIKSLNKEGYDFSVTPINLSNVYALTGTYEIIYERIYYQDDSITDIDECPFKRIVISVDAEKAISIVKEQTECGGDNEYNYTVNDNLGYMNFFGNCFKTDKDLESDYDLTIYNSQCSGDLDSRVVTLRKIDDYFVKLENKPWEK